jgi:hypothetical protein
LNNNNKIKGNEELMLVILNCILVHYQNDGWTVPNSYFRACENIYLNFFKKPTLLDKNCLLYYNTFTQGFLNILCLVSINFLPPEN